ncbi:MAG: hypothetical protein K2L14_06600 [Duncaniella sp.]|nr:hypothetical protein [Duncaniella sp.]
MKQILSSIIALLSFICIQAAETPVEYFDCGNPIKFDNTDFYFAWSAHPNQLYYIQEYLPAGENFEHYTRMLSISVIMVDSSPIDAVKAKIAELDERKKTDPVTNYVVAEKDGEYILEFIVSDSNNGEVNTVETDLHYYKSMMVNGKKASVLFFYSTRAYGDNITEFIQSIPEKRASWYKAMEDLHLNITLKELD